MSRGNQPVNIDAICTTRYDERSAIATHFRRDGIDPDEQHILDQMDANTALLEAATQCLWIARAWMTSLVPEGTRRIHDLEHQYLATYGVSPVAIGSD